MRKVLLVEKEDYLERALDDVLTLFRSFGRKLERDAIPDLVGVIVMTADNSGCLHWWTETCDVNRVHLEDQLFSDESISVNGIWLLLTLRRFDLHEPIPRHKSLDQILTIVGEEEHAKSKVRLYPVFPDYEPADSVAENLDYLRRTHNHILAPQQVLVSWKQANDFSTRVSVSLRPL